MYVAIEKVNNKNVVIGYVTITEAYGKNALDVSIDIMEIFIGYRNKGIGKALLHELETLLYDEHTRSVDKCDVFTIYVRPLNDAVNFWKKQNYTKTSDGKKDDNIFSKTIGKVTCNPLKDRKRKKLIN